MKRYEFQSENTITKNGIRIIADVNKIKKAHTYKFILCYLNSIRKAIIF